jgi:hypothetical protein
MSGGIGKKELSAKDIIDKNQAAFGCLDFYKVQSYSLRRRNIINLFLYY